MTKGQTGLVKQSKIDAILSLWSDNEEILPFNFIHKSLVEKDITKYTYQTLRLLTQLGEGTPKRKGLNYIKKLARGRYQSNVSSKEFKVFDYLQNLRQTSELTRTQIGGFLWRLCEIYFLGMPETAFQYKDVNYVFQVLGIRLAEVFEAMRSLAKEVKLQQGSGTNAQLLGLPAKVVRQVLLELIPYYLGSKAGLDYDGLNLEELNMALSKMMESLPDRIETETGSQKWSVQTLRQDILENIITANRSMKKQVLTVDEEHKEETLKVKDEDFALVVIRPEFLVDPPGYEMRQIRDSLLESKTEDALYIVSSLLSYERSNVVNSLRIYGSRYLGSQKTKEALDFYEKLYAADQVGHTISEFKMDSIRGMSINKKMKKEIHRTYCKNKEDVEKLARNHGAKTLIRYLPFSHCFMNFIIPTPEKEKTLTEFFPQFSEEQIHEWLTEGVALAEDVYARFIKKSEGSQAIATK